MTFFSNTFNLLHCTFLVCYVNLFSTVNDEECIKSEERDTIKISFFTQLLNFYDNPSLEQNRKVIRCIKSNVEDR